METSNETILPEVDAPEAAETVTRTRTPSYPDEAVLVRTELEVTRPKHKMIADAFSAKGTAVGKAIDAIIASEAAGAIKAGGFHEDPRGYIRSYVGKMVASGALQPK
jgi:hypothetical protein